MDEQTKKPVFDQAKPFEVPIMSGGEKRCVVRFPRMRSGASGRGSSAPSGASSAAGSRKAKRGPAEDQRGAVREVRLDQDGPAFDEAEAGIVIGRIERAQVSDVAREGVNYRIEMKVPGARVVHVLRMPTAKEMQDHERASTSVVAARRAVETRAFLEPSGALYDRLHVSDEGYAGVVPIVHKLAAVTEIIAQLAIEGDEDDPEA